MTLPRTILTLAVATTVCFAQFESGSKTIAGSVSWQKTYFEGQGGRSRLRIAPSLGYFVIDNLAVNVSLDFLRYSYPRRWRIDAHQTTTRLGIGAKYFVRNNYVGGSYLLSRWKGYATEVSILLEAGHLQGLNENLFLDFGVDFIRGISSLNSESSTITLGIGISTFF